MEDELILTMNQVWVCRECGLRHPMKTKDGNEEWAKHCGKLMKMQPTARFDAAMKADAGKGE